MMSQREFAKFLKRDGSCAATGEVSDRLVPNHRINRSVGGTNDPTNIVVMDSIINGLLESDATWRRKAIKYGWKLESWQNPAEEPYFHFGLRRWVLPDSEHGFKVVPIPKRVYGP